MQSEFNGKLLDISEINNEELWEELLKEKKVDCSLDNILKYNAKYDLTGDIVSLIEVNIDIINNNIKQYLRKHNRKVSNEIYLLLLELLKFDEISNENIFKLLDNCKGFKIEETDFEEINKDRIDELINRNYIFLNIENYIYVKENIEDKLFDFCKSNINDFVGIYDNIEIDHALAEKLVFSNINEKYKIFILEKIEYNVVYNTVDDANVFIKIINRDDSNYSDYFDFTRTKAFLDKSNNDIEKIKCIKKYLDSVTNDEIHLLLETLDNPNYKNISKNTLEKVDKISVEDPIAELIKLLKEKECIKVFYRKGFYYIKK